MWNRRLLRLRERNEAPAAVRGEAAEHGDSRGDPRQAGVSRGGHAPPGHLLEERQRDHF